MEVSDKILLKHVRRYRHILTSCCFSYRFVLGKHGNEDEAERTVTAAKVLEHKATTAEIKALMSDLQVLGRSEFKALLRWYAPSLVCNSV